MQVWPLYCGREKYGSVAVPKFSQRPEDCRKRKKEVRASEPKSFNPLHQRRHEYGLNDGYFELVVEILSRET